MEHLSIADAHDNDEQVSETARLADLDHLIRQLAQSSPTSDTTIKTWVSKNIFSVFLLCGWIGTSLIGGGGWLNKQDTSFKDVVAKQDELHQDFMKAQESNENTYARKDVVSEQLKRIEDNVRLLTDLARSDRGKSRPESNRFGG